MQYRSFVLILSVASAGVHAHSSFPNLPKCALDCALKSLEETKCEIDDMRCLCGDAGIAFKLGPCVLTSCSIPDMIKTTQEATNACFDAGFEIKLPGFAPIDIGGKPNERDDSSYADISSMRTQDATPTETNKYAITTTPSSNTSEDESATSTPTKYESIDTIVTLAPTTTLAYMPPTPTSTKTVQPTITVLPGNGTSSAMGLTSQIGSELRGLSVVFVVLLVGLI